MTDITPPIHWFGPEAVRNAKMQGVKDERARIVAQLRERSVKLDARDKGVDPRSIYSHDAAMCRSWADMIEKGERDD